MVLAQRLRKLPRPADVFLLKARRVQHGMEMEGVDEMAVGKGPGGLQTKCAPETGDGFVELADIGKGEAQIGMSPRLVLL